MIKIENMRPWEKVVKVIMRHWIVFISLWMQFLWWIIISIIIYEILWNNINSNLINILIWLCYSIFLYIEWVNHELDMYVITNYRIIWIEQLSFLNRTVSECDLWQVQEVNSKTAWILANIFNYWTISIQTAWSVITMRIELCPNSIEEARNILNVVYEYREKQKNKENKNDNNINLENEKA